MRKVKITMGTTYCGCPSEEFYLEVEDEKEYNSDKFSTEILNEIFNGGTEHFFLDVELMEDTAKYYKITCNNGFCGCDEVFYEKVEEDEDIDELATDILYNNYSFAEPDDRFLDYDEDYDEHIDNLNVEYEEITKKEYEENK